MSSAAMQPETRPMCPRHLERAAVRTCGRCGQFVCAGCMDVGDACQSCRLQLLDGVPRSDGRARWARRWLWVNVAADTLTLGSLALGGQNAEGNPAVLAVTAVSGVLTLVGIIGGAIAFLRWVHLVFRQGRALGAAGDITPGWAVGYWFIPFVNLVKPYRVLKDLLRNLAGSGAVASSRMAAWWTLWVVSNVLSNLETRLQLDGIESAIVSVISSATSIGAAILALGVVSAVQRAVDVRRAEAV